VLLGGTVTRAAETIDATTLARWLIDERVMVLDNRSSVRRQQGMLAVAFPVDGEPEQLELAGGITRLVVIPSTVSSAASRQRWQAWAERFGFPLYWLNYDASALARAGLETVIHPSGPETVSPLPQRFIIPRGLCELGEPAMVIERQQ